MQCGTAASPSTDYSTTLHCPWNEQPAVTWEGHKVLHWSRSAGYAAAVPHCRAAPAHALCQQRLEQHTAWQKLQITAPRGLPTLFTNIQNNDNNDIHTTKARMPAQCSDAASRPEHLVDSRAASPLCQHLARLAVLSQAKVSHLERRILTRCDEQEVLRLDIAHRNALGMALRHSPQDVSDDAAQQQPHKHAQHSTRSK